MLCGDIEYFEKLAKEFVAKDRLPPVSAGALFCQTRYFPPMGKMSETSSGKKTYEKKTTTNCHVTVPGYRK
jgi:hypothetical protein